jgi:hypothetical protein
VPIPGLVSKTHSPQKWRSQPERRFDAPTGPSGVRSTYAGGPRKKRSVKKIKHIVLYTIGTCFVVGMVFTAGVLAWVSKDLPNPNQIIDRSVAISTKIFDRTGAVLLYDIHGDEKRTLV